MATRRIAGAIAQATGGSADGFYNELVANLVGNSHIVPAVSWRSIVPRNEATRSPTSACDLELSGHRMHHTWAGLIEAIEIKRKMFFRFENAPYHCLDVESVETDGARRPDPGAGQDAELLTRRSLTKRSRRRKVQRARSRSGSASYLFADAEGYHFMDQETFETLTSARTPSATTPVARGHVIVQIHRYNGNSDRPAIPPTSSWR